MLPEEAVRFAEALGNGSGLDSAFMSDKRNQVLAAVNSLAGTPAAENPAITALVYVLWDQMTPEDLRRTRNWRIAWPSPWPINGTPKIRRWRASKRC